MKSLIRLPFYCLLLTLVMCSPPVAMDDSNWCSRELRKEFLPFEEVKTSQPWFRVFRVGKGVFAIAEPYNVQEVISYLIVGKNQCILFDTGMGMGRIATVVRELSPLPVIVINSHTHYDHIGGNKEFDTILAVDTAYTHTFSEKGWTHDQVRQEVQPGTFCAEKLPELDTASYAVMPYKNKIRDYLLEGATVDLGNRMVEVLRVPGHTPDCIALLDRVNGYLWTGDMFYEATIWLFFDGTDLDAYERSITRFAELAPMLTRIFPAHNTPAADPARLIELQEAFAQIRSGKVQGKENATSTHPEDKRAITFEFKHFSFLIRKDALK